MSTRTKHDFSVAVTVPFSKVDEFLQVVSDMGLTVREPKLVESDVPMTRAEMAVVRESRKEAARISTGSRRPAKALRPGKKGVANRKLVPSEIVGIYNDPREQSVIAEAWHTSKDTVRNVKVLLYPGYRRAVEAATNPTSDMVIGKIGSVRASVPHRVKGRKQVRPTEQQVINVYRDTGVPIEALARKYKLTPSTIRRIKAGVNACHRETLRKAGVILNLSH